MDTSDFIEKLDGKFRAAQPVSFVADIIADANIEKVVIEDLRVQDLAGKPQRFAYLLTLREFIEPIEPEDVSAINTNILDDALNLIDDLTIGFEIVEQLSAFVSRLTELSQSLQRQP
jgi:hypothetical protein